MLYIPRLVLYADKKIERSHEFMLIAERILIRDAEVRITDDDEPRARVYLHSSVQLLQLMSVCVYINSEFATWNIVSCR